jgi:hypothetical protein
LSILKTWLLAIRWPLRTKPFLVAHGICITPYSLEDYFLFPVQMNYPVIYLASLGSLVVVLVVQVAHWFSLVEFSMVLSFRSSFMASLMQ